MDLRQRHLRPLSTALRREPAEGTVATADAATCGVVSIKALLHGQASHAESKPGLLIAIACALGSAPAGAVVETCESASANYVTAVINSARYCLTQLAPRGRSCASRNRTPNLKAARVNLRCAPGTVERLACSARLAIIADRLSLRQLGRHRLHAPLHQRRLRQRRHRSRASSATTATSSTATAAPPPVSSRATAVATSAPASCRSPAPPSQPCALPAASAHRCS